MDQNQTPYKDRPVANSKPLSVTYTPSEIHRNELNGIGTSVVWAIDAFPDQLELHVKSATALQCLHPNARIFPVYVLSEESFTDRGISTFLKPALKPMAFKAVRTLIDQFQKLNLQKPRILVEQSASRPACARKLLRFAEKMGASEIALGSHARKGLSRFFVGSFSESLVDHSRLPVLVTGPHCNEMVSQPEVIVFPTDFAPGQDAAFVEIVRLAARTGAEIHLFHKTTYALDTFVQGGVQLLGGGWVTIDPYSTHEEHFETQVQKWLSTAAAQGVKTRIISENFREPTSQAIVEYAGQVGDRSTLVAMTFHDSKVGTVTGALLGNITRDVIRASPCPVYLYPRIV